MPTPPLEKPWASTGTREPTLSDAKRAAGFFGGDKVRGDRFNQLLGESQDSIKAIIQERVNLFYDGSADWKLAMSTGLWPDAWARPEDDANTISGGATKEYRDLCMFVNSDNESRLIVLDDANIKAEIWDPRAMTLEDTSDAFTADLPTGGGETWEAFSMCTDGTSIYVMFVDTNAAPDEYHIQAWDIATWDVKTGWAATGTVLPGTGTPTMTRPGRVIVASATKLATSNGWVTVSAATSDAISIIDMADGTIDDSAAGDCPTGDSAHPDLGICSDGTNVFFSADGTANNYICSATIANPQVGCGGANYPLTISAGNIFNMCSCGPNMMVSAIYDNTSAATDIVIRTHNATDADLDTIERGISSAAAALVGDIWTMDLPVDIKFDGIFVWVYCKIAMNSHMALLRIDASRLATEDASSPRQLGDISDTFLVPGSLDNFGTIIPDGRDVWVSPEGDASQTHSGKIYRLPIAATRS